ncbi:hypothetical protein CYJ18_03395 [Actinomyces naeslundii]|uniref:Uncharacterized protein n=1 Tax=Actinomyces naeslundii TaxID=1655 RepID=A0AA47FIB0_ACTNA|nr:hypothetical protein [Actinomyces naeslundii]PKY96303.1 hypothetical protein CYJ18_03395 [Actinomyces naeslundii]WAL43853.1 hypothetical protein OFA60_04700 [Actinomyces naeslundii]
MTNVAISTVNGAVNPEVEMSDRVASLLGTTLTEADVHRFLLDAADILGTESFAVYGPDLFFRWRLGERIVEIEPDYRPLRDEYELTVNSYNPTYPIDTDEYQSFKWGEAAWYPYLWSVELGRAPVSDWGPGEAYVVNWEMFEETTAKTLGGLPDNLALMPPQWRRPFTLRWDMGASDLGLVSFTGTAEGLTVTVESTGEQVLIPRNLLGSERSQISMRDVAAGLAGGRPLMDIRFAGSEGFGDYGLIAASPSGDEDDMERDEIEFLLKDREQDSLGPAMTMDELRRLAASTPTPSGPAQPAVNWQVVPMRIGLSIPQTLSVVEQVLDGAAIKNVLKRLGGRPGIRLDRPILRGDGWLAEKSRFSGIWGIEVVTAPEGDEEARLCFDECHVADYTWRIAQALEQHYGFPYGIRTTNDGFLMRLFQVGDHGVKVTSGFSKVEVEIDSFQTLLENTYGRY